MVNRLTSLRHACGIGGADQGAQRAVDAVQRPRQPGEGPGHLQAVGGQAGTQSPQPAQRVSSSSGSGSIRSSHQPRDHLDQQLARLRREVDVTGPRDKERATVRPPDG
jgi:hypothetical protein